MAVIDDIDQKCEGLLEIKDDNNIEWQFNNWMNVKNVSLNQENYNPVVQSNLIKNLLETIDIAKTQSPSKDICFGRSGFDRGGGYEKDTFDRACFEKS